MSLINIYIYTLEELENILYEKTNFPPEMDLFNLFSNQIKENYNIVKTIEDADLAFIPINYVKLIYRQSFIISCIILFMSSMFICYNYLYCSA